MIESAILTLVSFAAGMMAGYTFRLTAAVGSDRAAKMVRSVYLSFEIVAIVDEVLSGRCPDTPETWSGVLTRIVEFNRLQETP